MWNFKNTFRSVLQKSGQVVTLYSIQGGHPIQHTGGHPIQHTDK